MTDRPVSDLSRPDSPGQLGLQLAAEWQPHTATWLAWPHNRDTWPGSFEPIPRVWTELVEVIAAREPVHILAGTSPVMEEAERCVGHLREVTLHDVATNDAWLRDSGPMFLRSGDDRPEKLLRAAVVDWEYDAWGGKYPPFDLDNAIPRRVAELTDLDRYATGVVLEGGAVESNGRGSVLAGESCLVGKRRNAALARADFERLLQDFAGVQQVIWIAPLGDQTGIVGDDTDGHIDQLARFVAADRVVVAAEEDPADANFDFLANLWEQLTAARDAQGNPLELIRLPMPAAVTHQGERLPASYANFYVANDLVVVPQFDDPADAVTKEILGDCFPGREMYGFDSRALVRGLGGVHCVTLSQPALSVD